MYTISIQIDLFWIATSDSDQLIGLLHSAYLLNVCNPYKRDVVQWQSTCFIYMKTVSAVLVLPLLNFYGLGVRKKLPFLLNSPCLVLQPCYQALNKNNWWWWLYQGIKIGLRQLDHLSLLQTLCILGARKLCSLLRSASSLWQRQSQNIFLLAWSGFLFVRNRLFLLPQTNTAILHMTAVFLMGAFEQCSATWQLLLVVDHLSSLPVWGRRGSWHGQTQGGAMPLGDTKSWLLHAKIPLLRNRNTDIAVVLFFRLA